jgi:hypothetical protein
VISAKTSSSRLSSSVPPPSGPRSTHGSSHMAEGDVVNVLGGMPRLTKAEKDGKLARMPLKGRNERVGEAETSVCRI